MTADINTLLTALYVFVDDHLVPRRRGPDIITATRAYLDRAGQPHVHVVHGDRERGYPPAPAAHR